MFDALLMLRIAFAFGLIAGRQEMRSSQKGNDKLPYRDFDGDGFAAADNLVSSFIPAFADLRSDQQQLRDALFTPFNLFRSQRGDPKDVITIISSMYAYLDCIDEALGDHCRTLLRLGIFFPLSHTSEECSPDSCVVWRQPPLQII